MNTAFNHKKYGEYFYKENYVPKLDKARGKIVLYSRQLYKDEKFIVNILNLLQIYLGVVFNNLLIM